MPTKTSNSPRWEIVIYYIKEANLGPEIKYIEELSELQNLIEGGEDFRFIRKIEVRYNL